MDAAEDNAYIPHPPRRKVLFCPVDAEQAQTMHLVCPEEKQ
jgi:hypothetical protein